MNRQCLIRLDQKNKNLIGSAGCLGELWRLEGINFPGVHHDQLISQHTRAAASKADRQADKELKPFEHVVEAQKGLWIMNTPLSWYEEPRWRMPQSPVLLAYYHAGQGS